MIDERNLKDSDVYNKVNILLGHLPVFTPKTIVSMLILFIFAGYLTWCFIDNFYKLGALKKENKKTIAEIKALKVFKSKIPIDKFLKCFDVKYFILSI